MTNMTNVELPDSIRQMLSEEALEVYRKAYAASWDAYSPEVQRTMDQGAIAHRDAWEEVLKEFEQDTETGQWRRRGEQLVEQPENPSLLDRIKSALTR
jgi:cation transport regulator ChaB